MGVVIWLRDQSFFGTQSGARVEAFNGVQALEAIIVMNAAQIQGIIADYCNRQEFFSNRMEPVAASKVQFVIEQHHDDPAEFTGVKIVVKPK